MHVTAKQSEPVITSCAFNELHYKEEKNILDARSRKVTWWQKTCATVRQHKTIQEIVQMSS